MTLGLRVWPLEITAAQYFSHAPDLPLAQLPVARQVRGGLRIRLRERPGQLAYSTILKRWVGQFGYALFTAVPVLGNLLGFYPLVNYLWPVFDSKKQALHDKLAATNVVRQREDTWTPAADQQAYPGQQGY